MYYISGFGYLPAINYLVLQQEGNLSYMHVCVCVPWSAVHLPVHESPFGQETLLVKKPCPCCEYSVGFSEERLIVA